MIEYQVCKHSVVLRCSYQTWLFIKFNLINIYLFLPKDPHCSVFCALFFSIATLIQRLNSKIRNFLPTELTYSSRVRVLSYFLPSMIGSVLLNIPKFLEATLVPMTVVDHETNISSEIIIYNVTSLRLDPDYMYYYIHWTRWGRHPSINLF